MVSAPSLIIETEKAIAAWWRSREMPPGAYPAPGGVVWGSEEKYWGWRPLHQPWTTTDAPVRLEWGAIKSGTPRILFAGVWHPIERTVEWETEPPVWVERRMRSQSAETISARMYRLHEPLLQRVRQNVITTCGVDSLDAQSAVGTAFAETLAKFGSEKRPNCTWSQAIWVRSRQLSARTPTGLIAMPQRVMIAMSALNSVPERCRRSPEQAFKWLVDQRCTDDESQQKAYDTQKVGMVEFKSLEIAFEFPQVVFTDGKQDGWTEGETGRPESSVSPPDNDMIREGITDRVHLEMWDDGI